jgi:cyclomaltodextrinase
VGKPTQAEITKQYLIIGILMTMPGAPMIYYGDEAGMWGGDDPDCRKPMVWQELFYEPEVADPLGRFRSVDSVKFDSKIFNWYKKLISLRKKNRAFSLGDINFFLIDDNKKVVGYSRNLDKDVLYVFINNKNKSEEVSIGLKNTDEQLIDLINNEAISKKENAYKFSLPPYGIAVLK